MKTFHLAGLKWAAIAGLLGGLFAVAYVGHRLMWEERVKEGDEEKVQSPRRVKDGLIELGTEVAAARGIEEEAARKVRWQPRVAVYGRVVPNPRATCEIRAPFPGTLRADPDTDWPLPGQWLHAGQVLGWLDVRLAPQDRLTIQDNLNNARLKKDGAEKVVQLQQERVKRLEEVARSEIVSRQQLDDARILLAEAKTQLAVATAAVNLWQKALQDLDAPGNGKFSLYRQPLISPRDGEIADLTAQPGMAVEAGGLLAQVVDFRRGLARLEIPPDVLAAGAPAKVTLFSLQPPPRGLQGVLAPSAQSEQMPSAEGSLLGLAPKVDETSQFIGHWYAFEAPTQAEASLRTIWRPGLHLKAYMTPVSSQEKDAISVPVGAILFHQGHPLIYVAPAPGKYTRRSVRLLAREADRWFVEMRQGKGPSGISPGEAVVVRGGQLLLSEEYRSDVIAE